MFSRWTVFCCGSQQVAERSAHYDIACTLSAVKTVYSNFKAFYAVIVTLGIHIVWLRYCGSSYSRVTGVIIMHTFTATCWPRSTNNNKDSRTMRMCSIHEKYIFIRTFHSTKFCFFAHLRLGKVRNANA